MSVIESTVQCSVLVIISIVFVMFGPTLSLYYTFLKVKAYICESGAHHCFELYIADTWVGIPYCQVYNIYLSNIKIVINHYYYRLMC